MEGREKLRITGQSFNCQSTTKTIGRDVGCNKSRSEIKAVAQDGRPSWAAGESERMIAALYVMTNGPYFGLPDVDPWDITRDARKYSGPHPVIAHPPCERWGRYWFGGPSCKTRKIKGDDSGCFEAALNAVRKYGGVLEHPAASSAWAAFKIATPYRSGGWIMCDGYGGWTCCVDQGHYGHRAQKATWLYAVGVPNLPELIWGKSKNTVRLEDGFHSKAERERKRAIKTGLCQRLSHRERKETPAAFRDLLLDIARSVKEARPAPKSAPENAEEARFTDSQQPQECNAVKS